MRPPTGLDRRRPSRRLGRWLQGLFRRVPIGADGSARVGARQIYILPTRLGLFLGFVLFLMLIGSLNYQNNLGLLFTFFLTSVALVAVHHCWFNLLGLAVQARPGPAVFSGDSARFEVVLRNENRRPRYDLGVNRGAKVSHGLRLGPREQLTVTVARPTERRGYLYLEEVMVQTRHPMGLFRAWVQVTCRAKVLVYPRPADQAPPAPYAGCQAGHQSAQGRECAEDFLGSREYRPGDSPRHLDWKALARERGLVVKQFGGDLGQDQRIDWYALRVPDPEGRIGVLTRQVLDATGSGQRFALRLPGREIPLGHGVTHTRCCLTELALYDQGAAARPTG